MHEYWEGQRVGVVVLGLARIYIVPAALRRHVGLLGIMKGLPTVPRRDYCQHSACKRFLSRVAFHCRGFFFLVVKQTMQIFFRMPSGNHIVVNVDDPLKTTLAEVQRELFKRTNLPTTRQRFVHNGRQCTKEGTCTVGGLGWDHECTVHVHVRWHGVGCVCTWCNKHILLRDGTRVASFSSAVSA